ncbi:hypothetical protein [Stenotrophomonas sp.]|uniref:hypothetical protein n=1 Tax=Stenotrophomonas sp. TaxID=69392 RepID=UPI002897A168|nr:hypothetical protein [Stenotrophomonas sp.]
MHPSTKLGLCLVAMSVIAGANGCSEQPDAVPVDAVGQWLNDRAMRAAEKDHASGANQDLPEGVYRLIPVAELDAPEPVKQHFREKIERSRSGVMKVPTGAIPSEQQLVIALPKTKRSETTLRERLPNPPSNLQGTALTTAALIGMEPTGALHGLSSSGLSRFYRLKDIGIVEFNEHNFRMLGGVIEAFVEAQNTLINGVPGKIEMSVDDQGRGCVSLTWAGKDKVYTLTATGDDNVERKAEALRAIAESVVD